MSQLAKITDLFVEGGVLALSGPEGQVLPVWINKLTPFEVEQANHEGRIARARIILALREVGSPDYDIFQATIAETPRDAIIENLVNAKDNEFLMQAFQDVRSDPKWRERLEVLDWSREQVKDKPIDDPEVEVLRRVDAEYGEEIQRLLTIARRHFRDELEDMDQAKLEEAFRTSYLDQRGLGAFQVEHAKAEVFYALRQCKGVFKDGSWDHAACDHSQRMLDDRTEVARLPEQAYRAIRAYIQNLNMPRDIARFSGALASSSAPSGPSSSQEDSVASGQTETSDELVGT